MSLVKTQALAGIVGVKQARKLPKDINSLRNLSESDYVDLGLSRSSAARLVSCFVLAREIAAPYHVKQARITGPEAAKAYVKHRFADLQHAQQEEMWVVSLDTKNKPIMAHKVMVGTLRSCLVHPREIFAPVIVDRASAILLVHNHPSGDPTPSDQDIAVTERITQAAAIIGISLVDHIVLGGTEAVSIQEFQAS